MKKLAIVGTHPDTRENAPWNDPGFEIWVFNEAPQAEWCKRWDVCFQLHRPEVYTSANNMVDNTHWAWLQRDHGRRRIYMQDGDPRVPNSVPYPLDEVLAEVAKRKQLTSSPAYALALALLLGYEYIEVYGVELSSNTEYSYQLNNWNYWVGYADGRGVELELRGGECHFSARLYGFEGETQIERGYFEQRAAALEGEWKHAENAAKRAKDRLDQAIVARKAQKFPELVKDYQEKAIAAGEVSGAMAEAQRCAGRLDPIPRQEFERRSAQAQRDGEELRALMYHKEGMVEYVWNVWAQTGNYEALNQLRRFLGEEGQHAFDMGGRLGIFRENLRYMEEIDARVQAAGGQRTLQALGQA